MFDNFATCFAGFYASLFLILIYLEISNDNTLFYIIIEIHCLCFSSEWNWNIKRKKMPEVNDTDNVERQRLLSFPLGLIVGKIVKIHVLFNVSLF